MRSANDRVRGRHVLVSGGSSGIGLATTAALLERGALVSILSLGVESAQPYLDGVPERVRCFPCDVREEASVEAAVGRAVAWAGRPTGVVAAAGIGVSGSVADTGEADAQDVLQTNYFGVVRLVRSVLRLGPTEPPLRLVVVGSLGGRVAVPFQAHYSASKAALDRFAAALAIELRPSGARVCLVEPGEINTRFNDVTRWLPASPTYQDAAERVEEAIRAAGRRAPSPDLVAAAIVRALSAVRPRHRYTVGPQRRQVAIGTRLLPDTAQLRLLERNFGLCPSSPPEG